MSKEQESALELELQESDMSVTPNEIRNAEFATGMRGFNRDEVDEFLQKAASALEDALAETAELREQQKDLQEKYEKLASMEDALKSTLLEAQKTADTIRANADRDVQLALDRARGKQALVEDQTNEKIAELYEKVRELDKIRLDYKEKIKQTIASHLQILGDISFTVELPETPEEDYSEDNKSQDIDSQDTASKDTDSKDTDSKDTDSQNNYSKDNVSPDLEQAEIEEVTLFEPAVTEVEKVAQSKESNEPVTTSESYPQSQRQPQSQASASLHFDMKKLSCDDPQQHEKQPVPSESQATSEAIARAVTKKGSPEEVIDDTLYKKLAANVEETSQPTSAVTTSAGKEPADISNKPKTRSNMETGADGIVVFGRKEDREKAVEENARILSELDSVVDKFAEELREIENK